MYVSTHSPSVIASSAGLEAELLAALVEYDKDMYHVGFSAAATIVQYILFVGRRYSKLRVLYTRDPPAKLTAVVWSAVARS